jgi:hypothetical protein
VKRFGKYRRQLWKYLKIVEERKIEMWNDMENIEENCEIIWKISKASWILKRYGQYGRKLWNDMENMEENSEKI